MLINTLAKFTDIQAGFSIPRRRFWGWLNFIWNRVDEDRIKEVGPDRACAEWLMRNGAFVKWAGSSSYVNDYNNLPSVKNISHRSFKVGEVDATDSSIMYTGFSYFVGCKHIKKIKLRRCNNIENRALQNLAYVKETLEELQVISCGNVSDEGIKSLQTLSNLKHVLLFDLPEVTNRQDCLHVLNKFLPKCDISFPLENEKTKKELGESVPSENSKP